MSLSQLRTANFGKSKANLTGSLGVGYTLLSYDGSTTQARTTSGVYQLTSGSGLYSAYVAFPDSFRGQVMWDTGEVLIASRSFACEQYNYEENNPLVDSISSTLTLMSGTLETIKKMTTGRWTITGNQMIFYDTDNTTEVARFDLKDSAGNPSMTSVFDRVRV